MAPDSPLAVVRRRRLVAAQPGAVTGLTVRYDFLVVPAADADGTPNSALVATLRAKRALALRAETPRLRFVEGQYGGNHIPGALQPVESAPPLVRGVQPIRTTGPTADQLRQGANPPWGFSGLCLSVQHADGEAGAAGKDLDSARRLWWSSTSHQVEFQYRNGAGQRKILPTLFRSRPIASYFPAWPQSPLPKAAEMSLASWQAVMIGSCRSLICGARPGVPFVLRQQLQTQDLGTAPFRVFSGAIPCQHRMPRPVLMPGNKVDGETIYPDYAVQTWGTYFDAFSSGFGGETLRASFDPIDSVFQSHDSGADGCLFALAGPMPDPKRARGRSDRRRNDSAEMERQDRDSDDEADANGLVGKTGRSPRRRAPSPFRSRNRPRKTLPRIRPNMFSIRWTPSRATSCSVHGWRRSRMAIPQPCS